MIEYNGMLMPCLFVIFLFQGDELRQRHEDMIAAQRKEAQRIRGRMEEGRQNIKQYQKEVVYDFIKVRRACLPGMLITFLSQICVQPENLRAK